MSLLYVRDLSVVVVLRLRVCVCVCLCIVCLTLVCDIWSRTYYDEFLDHPSPQRGEILQTARDDCLSMLLLDMPALEP